MSVVRKYYDIVCLEQLRFFAFAPMRFRLLLVVVLSYSRRFLLLFFTGIPRLFPFLPSLLHSSLAIIVGEFEPVNLRDFGCCASVEGPIFVFLHWGRTG